MKLSLAFLPLTLIAFYSRSQTCVFSGTVKNALVNELQLSLIYADDDYKPYTTQIKISNGHFRQSITLHWPVSALLTGDNIRKRLLLSPGRDLQINIDSTVEYKGKAAIENALVSRSILDTMPFFLKGRWLEDKKQYDETIPYSKVTLDSWQALIIDRVQQELVEATANIQRAAIPARLKKILVSETMYAYQVHLADFAMNRLRFSQNQDRDSITALVLQWQPAPDSFSLAGGYYANQMMRRRCGNSLYKLKRKAANENEWKAQAAAYLQTPFPTIDSLAKQHNGDVIVTWLYTIHHLPPAVQDKMIFNNIILMSHLNSYKTASFLLNYLQQHYPNSTYLSLAKTAVQGLKKEILSNQNNQRIRFNTAAGIRSLNELVKPYKNKVVYMDIWGTWCGPCKQEMNYVKELKQKYAGKDVVFLYLDMDEAAKESAWKEYVLIEGLEGEHYRMDGTAITAIWNDLQKAGAKRLYTYPTYFIFDRQGNIVHADAERPGSREKLHAQLDKIL